MIFDRGTINIYKFSHVCDILYHIICLVSREVVGAYSYINQASNTPKTVKIMNARCVTPTVNIISENPWRVVYSAPSLQELSANQVHWNVKDAKQTDIGIGCRYWKSETIYEVVIPLELYNELNVNCIRELKKQIVKNSDLEIDGHGELVGNLIRIFK